MNTKEKLENIFKNLPSVGPKQSERIVNFLLYQNDEYLEELTRLITNLKNEVLKCKVCNRFFNKNIKTKDTLICETCSDEKRDYSKILIIEKNTDFKNIEKFNIWDGLYYVLGRNLRINEKENKNIFNLTNLLKEERLELLSEVVFALSVNPEGEKTQQYIVNILKPYAEKYNFKIKQLGRGLSLGSEIQYSDEVTLLEAFKNKK